MKLRIRCKDMANVEIQHLDRQLFKLVQVSESCMDPNAVNAAEIAEEQVFELKVSVILAEGLRRESFSQTEIHALKGVTHFKKDLCF